MGPITLFDKSFLQQLNADEAVWFDNFFYPVIAPLFFIETLADLEKAPREGKTAEEGFVANNMATSSYKSLKTFLAESESRSLVP